MIRILGVDPSLTRTGLCYPDGSTAAVATDPKRWPDTFDRIDVIVAHVLRHAEVANLVVIEGAMMDARVGPETMFLHGVIRYRLRRMNIPFVDIAGASRQKYACGSSKDRGKDAVLAAAIRDGSDCTNNDQADAYWLWRIATDAYGPADADLPAYRREVLHRYSPWPEINGHAPVWSLPPKPKKEKAA